jgi:hypothetical protein
MSLGCNPMVRRANQHAGNAILTAKVVDLTVFLIPLLSFQYSDGYPLLEPDEQLSHKASIT